MSLDVHPADEELVALAAAYRKALEAIAELPRRYGHFDGHLAAGEAVAIATRALHPKPPVGQNPRKFQISGDGESST